MAPASIAGLDLQNLSGNWRKLQETLKADAGNPPKRKAAVLEKPQRNAKHRKLEDKSQDPSRFQTNQEDTKMGLTWSSSQKQDAPSATLALWAEDNDISPKDFHAAYGTSLKSTSMPDFHARKDVVNEGFSATALSSAGKYIAIDCEMVGVGPNPERDSALARVSIVNYHGYQLYDSFVKPKEAVTDHRTAVSGITSALLSQARTLEAVQHDVVQLFEGRILVGHAIRNDLDALLLGHSKRDIRDTSRHPAFRSLAGGRTPALKKLAKEVLGVNIQGGEHSSIEDARATMLLFRREKEAFEREHVKRWGPDRTTIEGNGQQKKSKKRKKKAKK